MHTYPDRHSQSYARLLSAILVALCLALSAQAASVYDLTHILINGDTEVEITDCNTAATGALVIPDTIEGNPVTSIGNSAFLKCTNLTSVTIPSTVTSLGIDAFRGCSSLASITIPSSVTSIGKRGFQGCSSLTIPRMEGNAPTVGANIFFGTASGAFVMVTDSATGYDVTFGGLPVIKQSIVEGVLAPEIAAAEAAGEVIGEAAGIVIGENNVLTDPPSFGLYDTTNIMDLGIGGVMVEKSGATLDFTYTIEESDDLTVWTTHSTPSVSITPAADKYFMRVKIMD